MAANFPGAGNAVPGVTYATVLIDHTEVKAYHEFETTYASSSPERMVCKKCGLKAREGNPFDKKEDVEIEINISDSYEQKNYWRIEISDNGPGIGDEMKKFLFDRYERSKGTIHGSGFGLTLVKVIIESYNGKIFAEDKIPSDKQKGTKIVFEIPKSVIFTMPDFRSIILAGFISLWITPLSWA